MTANAHGESSGARVEALDGARGIAILLVLFGHGLSGLPISSRADHALTAVASSGWIGVELFFVLSGYLITGILLDSRGSSHQLRNFYARRALRIIPLYYCVLLLLALSGILHPFSNLAGPKAWAGVQLWYWLFLVNVLVALRGWPAAPCDTGHLWSLSVEEQFYALWPLFIRNLTARGVAIAAVAATIAAVALRVWLIHAQVSPDAVYVLTPTHVDGLAVGALLASASRQPALLAFVRRVTPAVSVTAAVFLIAVVTARRAEDVPLSIASPAIESIGYTALALLCGSLIVASQQSQWVNNALSRRSWQTFGKYSYCLYVTHGPILYALDAASRNTFLSRPIAGGFVLQSIFRLTLLLGLGLAIAMISWRFFEQPILALKRFVPLQNGPRADGSRS